MSLLSLLSLYTDNSGLKLEEASHTFLFKNVFLKVDKLIRFCF